MKKILIALKWIVTSKSIYIMLLFFLIVIKLYALNNISNKINITINPNGLSKYVISLNTVLNDFIYRVPPHNGHGFPVTFKYAHSNKLGNIGVIKSEIKGKKIIYIANIKLIIFKYI